jgi:hypothetical protein
MKKTIARPRLENVIDDLMARRRLERRENDLLL